MSVDAVLTAVSLLSFVALFATWIASPLSADAPAVAVPAVEAAPSSAAIAA
jgi:hypothetical protein